MTPCIGVNVDVKGVEGMGGQARPKGHHVQSAKPVQSPRRNTDI